MEPINGSEMLTDLQVLLPADRADRVRWSREQHVSSLDCGQRHDVPHCFLRLRTIR